MIQHHVRLVAILKFAVSKVGEFITPFEAAKHLQEYYCLYPTVVQVNNTFRRISELNEGCSLVHGCLVFETAEMKAGREKREKLERREKVLQELNQNIDAKKALWDKFAEELAAIEKKESALQEEMCVLAA